MRVDDNGLTKSFSVPSIVTDDVVDVIARTVPACLMGCILSIISFVRWKEWLK